MKPMKFGMHVDENECYLTLPAPKRERWQLEQELKQIQLTLFTKGKELSPGHKRYLERLKEHLRKELS